MLLLAWLVAAGDQWRINFSRVHWNVTFSEQEQRYVKDPLDQPGYNFVWSPQWQVQMHQPETWGYLQFEGTPGALSSSVVTRGQTERLIQLHWQLLQLVVVLAAGKDSSGFACTSTCTCAFHL